MYSIEIAGFDDFAILCHDGNLDDARLIAGKASLFVPFQRSVYSSTQGIDDSMKTADSFPPQSIRRNTKFYAHSVVFYKSIGFRLESGTRRRCNLRMFSGFIRHPELPLCHVSPKRPSLWLRILKCISKSIEMSF